MAGQSNNNNSHIVLLVTQNSLAGRMRAAGWAVLVYTVKFSARLRSGILVTFILQSDFE